METSYIGQRLIERGFKTFFLYLFRVMEKRPFVIEPIHEDLFNEFISIYNGQKKRSVINLPPRAGKTVMAKYFVIWVLTVCPNAQIIYTSYSQSLLNTISEEIANILDSDIYKALFPTNIVRQEIEEVNAIDDFWLAYLQKETGKNKYSSRKIITWAGGVCLFASVGAQITGYGFSIRNAKKFSGMLIQDDFQKPADVRSKVMRDKALRYYEETLLSRANNPDAPIINIQQRLHIDDISGILERKYKFDILKKPLLDENGVCQIPTQYNEERIKELQVNNYMFSAQYQQEPIVLGGEVIKRSWFRYYPLENFKYKNIIITADTAMKVKEHNDYSVFIVGGVTENNQLHIIDMVRGKWEAPELKKVAIEVFEKYKYNQNTGVACSGLYIEDKASGTGLIQELKRGGVPVVGVQVHNDKLTRIEEVLSYIESGQVLLPVNENYSFNKDLLDECEAFTRDDSHIHDDICDALAMNIKQALAKAKVSLLDFFME